MEVIPETRCLHDVDAGGLLFSVCIIRPLISALSLTWFIIYIYY